MQILTWQIDKNTNRNKNNLHNISIMVSYKVCEMATRNPSAMVPVPFYGRVLNTLSESAGKSNYFLASGKDD